MNVVILIGNLARDPEKTFTNSGMAVTRFTVAINRFSRKEGGDSADFIRVTAFDKQAELVEKYLHKGSKVGVEGRIQTGSYEKDGKTVYTTDVIANRVEFLDSRRDSDNRESGFGGGQFSDRADSGFSEKQDSGFAALPKQPDGPAPAPPGFEELDDSDMPF